MTETVARPRQFLISVLESSATLSFNTAPQLPMAVYTAQNRHRRARVSAGLLMYRKRGGRVEVFIAHPGGPWFPNRDYDVWTIPKGELEAGEDLLDAAIREFEEEVGIKPEGPYLELGSIRQKGGKTVHAWAFAGDYDDSQPLRSNHVQIEWPPGSGRWDAWPEIDRACFFTLEAARERLKLSQHPLLERLIACLASIPPGDTDSEDYSKPHAGADTHSSDLQP